MILAAFLLVWCCTLASCFARRLATAFKCFRLFLRSRLPSTSTGDIINRYSMKIAASHWSFICELFAALSSFLEPDTSQGPTVEYCCVCDLFQNDLQTFHWVSSPICSSGWFPVRISYGTKMTLPELHAGCDLLRRSISLI